MKKYDDIINLPYHKNIHRKQMSMENRAAQFAPFAALAGYSEAIKETGRLTDRKIEVNDDLKDYLNYKLMLLKSKIKNKPLVNITYFIKDKYKSGGRYDNITNRLKNIKEIEGYIVLDNNLKIRVDDILNIDYDII